MEPRPARLHWTASPVLPPELARAWAEEWQRWFGPERVPLPRAPERHDLCLIETPLGRLAVKRETPEGWKGSLSALHARPLRSRRAFERAQMLLARGFLTPEPLAVLERRRPGSREAVLVTRYVEGVGPWDYLRRGGAPARLIAALASALARLHAAGFRHRDLKESNLLLRETAAGDLEVVWTDLEGLRLLGTLPSLLRARDLARLRMSSESAAARAAGVRADFWPAFVRAYLERALGHEPSAEEQALYLERTRRWCERAIRRHLAQGRPVR